MSADLAALEFANDAFYQAFAAGSLESMAAVWAEQPNVFCVHPGWAPLTTRDEVMASWRDILGSAGPVPVSAVAPKATIMGDVGLVCCYERVGHQHLVASNIFVRAGGGWRMVHHHAGPLARVPEEARVRDEPAPRH